MTKQETVSSYKELILRFCLVQVIISLPPLSISFFFALRCVGRLVTKGTPTFMSARCLWRVVLESAEPVIFVRDMS